MSIISIGNFRAWATLIKRWANDDSLRPPASTGRVQIDELIRQSNAVGAGLSCTKGSKKINWVCIPKMSDEEVVIILPHKDDIDHFELTPGTPHYDDLPDEYDKLYVPIVERKKLEGSEAEDFRMLRIGEYSVTKCK